MKLIVIDGLDASGKDTQAEITKSKREQLGERVLVRSHPAEDNLFGRIAKKALLGSGKANRIKASMFYAFDVLRSLRRYCRSKDYDTLIIVRYLMGTAYLPLPLARAAYKFFETVLPTSDAMFFLDVSPEVALKRLKGRSAREAFETGEELEKVRRKTLVLAREGWHVLNADQPQEKIAAEMEKILNAAEL